MLASPVYWLALGSTTQRTCGEIRTGSFFNPPLPILLRVALGKLNFLLTNPDEAELCFPSVRVGGGTWRLPTALPCSAWSSFYSCSTH